MCDDQNMGIFKFDKITGIIKIYSILVCNDIRTQFVVNRVLMGTLFKSIKYLLNEI